MSTTVSRAIIATKPFSKALAALWVMAAGAQAHAASALGHVSYVTSKHAFLEEGTEDGVHLGDVLTFEGTSRTCKVDLVSEHHARCVGNRLPGNGRFMIRHPALDTRALERRPAVKVLSHARVKEVHSALASTPFERVAVTGLSSREAAQGFAALSHSAYVWFGSQPRSVQGERLELAARVAPFASYRDLQAALRLTALYWSQETMPLRYDNGTPEQLYIHQGDVSARGRQHQFTFAVGRTLLWNTPGMSVLDGAQLGYRNKDGTFELGAFGGMIPFPGLAINTGHTTFGLYSMWQGGFGKTVLRDTARLAYVITPGASQHLEFETRAELNYRGLLQLGVTPRWGFALLNNAFALDAVRADGMVAPLDNLYISATVRYAKGAVDTFSQGIIAPPNILRTTYFSSISAMYQPFSWGGLGVLNVIDHDNATGQQRMLTGPQLSFPHFFGRWGDLSATLLYEITTIPGTTAVVFNVPSPVQAYAANIQTYSGFAQALFTPREDINVWLRVVWMSDGYQQGSFLQQLGYYVRAEGILTPWLGVNGFVRVNEALPNPKVFLPLPVNVTGTLQLVAHL